MAHIKTEHISGPKVCDPASQESLDSLIGLAKSWLESTERPAKQVFGYLGRIRNHVLWKRKYESGNNTWEEFCEDCLGRPAEYFEWVRIGIECADGTVSVKEAAQLGKVELNRRQEAAKLAEEIRKKKAEEPSLSQSEIGEMFGVSQQRVSQVTSERDESSISLVTVQQECKATGKSKQTIDRQRKLLKVRPDLYDKVVAGSKTLNAACVAAGIVKNPGPLEKILKLLPKLSKDEIQQLKKKMSELE